MIVLPFYTRGQIMRVNIIGEFEMSARHVIGVPRVLNSLWLDEDIRNPAIRLL